MQTLTHISLYSSALKTIIARFISLFDLLLKNGTFSKYQALMAYCAGQKLSDFHMIKYVVYKLQTAAHVAYKRDKQFFSQDQSWVGLSFSYNKCSNPQKWGFLAINVLHREVKEKGFFCCPSGAEHSHNRQSCAVVLFALSACCVILGDSGFESVSSQGER